MSVNIPTADILWTDYQRLGALGQVAQLYNVCRETIVLYLTKAGYYKPRPKSSNKWTAQDITLLIEWYASRKTSQVLCLNDLEKILHRNKYTICKKARQLNLTQLQRPKTGHRKPRPLPIFATAQERSRATSEWVKRYIREKGHPRGASGITFSQEARDKISRSSKAAWADPNSKLNSEEARQRRSDQVIRQIKNGDGFGSSNRNPYSRARGGIREDLNQFFRSSWEANYARYLQFLKARGEIQDWEYEVQTFWFDKIKRGCRSYTPDFKVTSLDGSYEWHEVKGWMDQKSITRLRRMAKYYPQEKVIVIDSRWFKQARRQGLDGVVANWE